MNIKSISSESDSVNLGHMLRMILMQSKLIILLTLIGLGAGVLLYLNTDKTYKFTSLLQVINSQPKYGDNMALDLYLGDSNTSDIGSIEDLYKSKTNMVELVEDLKLNLIVKELNFSEKIELFEVFSTQKQNSEFYLELNPASYRLYDSSNEYIGEFKYEELYVLESLSLKINTPSFRKEGKIFIQNFDKEIFFKTVKPRFVVSTSRPERTYLPFQTGLLQITFVSNDKDEAKAILNYANNLFIKKNIETDSQQARTALEFINLRIENIEKDLLVQKESLNEFQKRNQTVNVDLETSAIIANVNQIQAKLNEIEIELGQASNDFTETNPLFIDMINKRQILIEQKKQIESQIEKLPVAQQEYIELLRQVQLSQNVFADLTEKKLELSIKEASTLGNIRIVDGAYFDRVTNPQTTIIFFSTLLAAIFSLIIAIVRGYYFIPISNPAEFQDNDINETMIGVIPQIAEDIEEERFTQAFESLVVNIKNILLSNRGTTDSNKAKIILITSATSGNGKSFISRELSRKLASLDNKVLLLDNDLKRGDQHKEFKTNKISKKTFFNTDASNIENLKQGDNLYLVPKISGLMSSFQMIYSSEYQNKMEEFKDIFDYIVIDTPPILSVSDTSIMLSMSDLNIAVCRHGLTKISEIKQMLKLNEQVGSRFDGFIYNGYERPSSYYGYYSLYGNYAYQYYAKKYLYDSYDYGEDK